MTTTHLDIRPAPWMDEEWRPVLGYEGCYEVSNLGRVRSLPRRAIRRDGTTLPVAGRVLKSWLAKGYPAVNMSVDGRWAQKLIHIMVCEAWHGPRPPGMMARHLDDVPTNISPDNLAWGERKDNAQDALRNGRNVLANRTHCKHGHPYSPDNTYVNPLGHRSCRTCTRTYEKARRQRLREEQGK